MWTKKSYDALYDWIDPSKKEAAKKTLLADGLTDIVNRLETAANMGEWYKITHEAAAAVGPKIVEASATEAEMELDKAAAAFFEALGLFFLITTVRDFSAHARREGFIGLLATCLLWVYAVWEATHVAAAFDRDTPESYMAVFGIIGTIVCIVRIVELRIALTVTSAVQRTDYRKQLNELAGKVNRYEAEMKAEEDRKKAEADRLAQLEAAEAERRKEEEIATMRRELAAARRELSKVEATPGGKIKVSAEKVNAAIRDFMRKNRGMKPSRAQIAAAVQVDERSLRNHFPNGSLDTVIEQLFREVNQQPETTDAR